jgi:predicted anti-sigma-YlaC factor YlaD
MTKRKSIYTATYRRERRRRVFRWAPAAVGTAMAAVLGLAGVMVVGMNTKT